MKARQLFSRPESSGSLTVRKHTPWIASPLQEIDNPLTERNSRPEADEPPRPNDVLAFNATQAGERGFQVPAFKHNQESTTVELFYDLFFVANLATFTANHEIVDVKSLKNYIGFFTLLWFTWLQTSLFDVRFASDSFFDRVCKAISFGVMTGFAITGAIYDTTNIEDNVKAFRAMSIILMISRLALITQYGVVLWYIRKYRNTFIPLLATMASLFVAAVIFLGTFFGFPVKDHEGESETDLTQPDTYIAWYVVVCVEAAAVIAISCVWRVVSFKRTHLVERIGLLTLIIMGEGVLGMTKSVSRILQNSRNTTGSDVGVIMSSVLLIYFIWVLYFDQIEHDRFGTIRQQIWAILHFPLHVAILLTVEGGTTLILWNIITRYVTTWESYWNFPTTVNSTGGLVLWYETGLEHVEGLFKKGQLEESYNYRLNLTTLANITATYRSDKWHEEADSVLVDLWVGIANAIFEHFGIEAPEPAGKEETSVVVAKLAASLNVFATVFAYFYIAAGAFLLLLAVMYWFGKTKKSVGEWLSILVRAVFGVCVAMFCLFSFIENGAQDGFTSSFWPIPVVMIAYFIGKFDPAEYIPMPLADISAVIILDNLLVWHTNKTIARQTAHIRPDIETPPLSQHQSTKISPGTPHDSLILVPQYSGRADAPKADR